MRGLLIILLLAGLSVNSQPSRFTQIEDADEHLKHRNYLMAIPIYKEELKKDWNNVRIKYKLGICYLNTRLNHEEAVPYLEQASRDARTEDEVWMHLGRAYMLVNRIEDAIACFEKYKTKYPKKTEPVKRLRECANALEFMRNPSRVTFQNLGPAINSDEPDYNPYVDKDESILLFTSRRKDNIGGKKQEVDGYRNSDIYQCTSQNGKWSPARNAGRTVNGSLDEQITGVSPDGREMYLYVDHIDRVGDLYYAAKKEGATEFSKPRPIEGRVNTEFETSGTMTGDVLVFARKGKGRTDIDLFISRRLPNGQWSEGVRLPDIINTPYNEDMPFVSLDGKWLYFASEGHNSMGGYDLFRSSWDQSTNQFAKPENLGFPINTTDDDMSICVTSDNSYAYVSSFRGNGIGDLDIYRVRLNNTDLVSVIFTGNVYLNDSIPQSTPSPNAVSIIVTDTKTNYEYMFVPNPRTGRYVMALPAGTYQLTGHARGFAKYKEDLDVEDVGTTQRERQKDIMLVRKKKSAD
jgi:hypothetical protein